MGFSRFAFLLILAVMPGSNASAAVVVNEVFYNAPSDLEDLQWIELHNTDDRAADVGGWELDQGKTFTFPPGTTIAAKGYLVVALDPQQFAKAYGTTAIGALKRPLKRGGERIELRDAKGTPRDVAKYKDESPWPVSADGYSASIERICPTASGDVAENWAGSPLPPAPKPSGTPGQANASYSAVLPPVVSVSEAPAFLAPGRTLAVRATIKGDAPVGEVALLYRVVTNEAAGAEVALPMTKDAGGHFVASIPAQRAGVLLRYRVRAVAENGARRFFPAENELRPTLSTYVHGPWESAPIHLALVVLGGTDRAATTQDPRRGGPRGGFGRPGGFRGGRFGMEVEERPRPPRGASALIHVDPTSGKAELFDHVNVVSRGRKPGYMVFFHKDRPLNGMTAVSLVFEGNERSLLAEALSYDVYRRAGNAAPLTEFIRLSVDGRPHGYHLMVERPNKAFLRRNRLDDGGNLYKARWFGQGIIGQHVKKTHVTAGHDDLLDVIERLQETSGDSAAQWALIRERFDVQQMATHFAVNMVVSHWDGFFNNFYTYHDTKRGKWQMYPWDHDQTWGMTGWGGGAPLVEIPLTFGMEGAAPPGDRQQGRRGGAGGFGGPFGGGPGWWRPPGYFSGPLLANPEFRKVFLASVRKILDETYTEERYVPMIDDLVRTLGDDAALRAQARGDDAAAGRQALAESADFLKAHLRQRREYLLGQEELRSAKP